MLKTLLPEIFFKKKTVKLCFDPLVSQLQKSLPTEPNLLRNLWDLLRFVAITAISYGQNFHLDLKKKIHYH